MSTSETKEIVLLLPIDVIGRLHETSARLHESVDNIVTDLLNLLLPPLHFTNGEEYVNSIRELSELNLEQLQECANADMNFESKARGLELLVMDRRRNLSQSERKELDELLNKGTTIGITRMAASWLLYEREKMMGKPTI